MRAAQLTILISTVALTGCNLLLETTNNVYGSGSGASAGSGGEGGLGMGTGAGGGGVGGDEGGGGSGAGGGGADCGGEPNDDAGDCLDTSCCGQTSSTCTSFGTDVDFGALCSGANATQDLDETFDDGALDRWAVKYWDSCQSDVALCDNHLVIAPAPYNDFWFDQVPGPGERAPMAYRRLCGSFMIATQVSTTASLGSYNGVALTMVHPSDDLIWTMLSHGNQDPYPDETLSLGTKLYPTLSDGQGDAFTNNDTWDNPDGGVYSSVNTSTTLAACRLPDRSFLFYRIEPGGSLERILENKAPEPAFPEYGMAATACVDAGLTAHYFEEINGESPAGTHDRVAIRGGIDSQAACEAAINAAFPH